MSKVRDDRESFGGHLREPRGRDGLSRRDLLKTAAGAMFAAAGAGIGGAVGARAQVQGSMPEGGTVPFRLPMGAMNYLDPKMYIHNMEIHSHLPGGSGSGNDGVTCPLWARGAQRIFPPGGVDITDPKNPFIAFRGTPGGNIAYVKSLKKWIVLNSGFAALTAPNPTYPHGQWDEAYKQKALAYAGFKGVRTYDITDPSKPDQVGEFNTGSTGRGTHANFWEGGKYAYLDCGWDNQLRMESSERPYSNALMIVDMTDPGSIKEVSRWWVPGQRFGEEEEYKKFVFANDHSSWTSNHGGCTVPKRVEDGGTIGYCPMGAFGMYVLDLSDIRHPKPIGRVVDELEAMGGIPYHSIYPVIADAAHPNLQDLLITPFESLESDCREPWHTPHVVNVKDPRHPKIIGEFPRPEAPPDAPYSDFCFARGRFSSHNIQAWAAPGVQKPNFVAMTYFNAGLQIFDISDPTEPKRVAYFVPPRRGNMNEWETWRRADVSVYVEWDRNLIWCSSVYLGEPHGELYCLSTPLLGKPILEPRKVERWTLPFINEGWDDQTPKSAYFGRGISQMG
jgi:hypothetical protein